jgi:DNA-binding MarR family transcriptional regulator
MKLQEELKRPIAFASTEQETLLNLLRIGDQLQNRLSRFFRDQGLTLSRFNVLRSLIIADCPLTCGEISERMIQAVPAITSLIDHLETQGLVQRVRSVDDRRVIHILVTSQGRSLADAAMKPLADLEKRLLKQLRHEEQLNLIELLEKARESVSMCDRDV